jgi:hypothetical protein
MGDGKRGNIVYVTDIGLAKEIEDRDWHSYPVVSTIRYASIKAHLRKGKRRTFTSKVPTNMAIQSSLPAMA